MLGVKPANASGKIQNQAPVMIQSAPNTNVHAKPLAKRAFGFLAGLAVLFFGRSRVVVPFAHDDQEYHIRLHLRLPSRGSRRPRCQVRQHAFDRNDAPSL